jgi:YHS domain-containing protein
LEARLGPFSRKSAIIANQSEEIMKSLNQSLWKTSLHFLIAVCICACVSATAFAQARGDDAEPALEGLDPILLLQGKEVQGNFKITVTRGRFQYMFATEEDKAIFEKDPTHYEIQLNGACARMGAPVNGNPDLYSVHKGRIYIFGSPGCKKLFDAAPEKYLEEAGSAKSAEPASPEALKKGHDLIEKAVAAMGAPIDSLSDYQEKSVSLQNRRGNDVEVKTDLIIVFPDRMRSEQVGPDFANPTVTRKFAVVMTESEAFSVTPDGVQALPDVYRTVQRQELSRRPLAILRARKAANFKAVALGAATVAETPVEQVAIELDGASYTLGIDPANGRIVSMAYRRRGPAGDFGEVVKVFSDFRTVSGVTLPFKVAATFNGTAWREQSAAIESIAVNSKVDTALFEKPKTQ